MVTKLLCALKHVCLLSLGSPRSLKDSRSHVSPANKQGGASIPWHQKSRAHPQWTEHSSLTHVLSLPLTPRCFSVQADRPSLPLLCAPESYSSRPPLKGIFPTKCSLILLHFLPAWLILLSPRASILLPAALCISFCHFKSYPLQVCSSDLKTCVLAVSSSGLAHGQGLTRVGGGQRRSDRPSVSGMTSASSAATARGPQSREVTRFDNTDMNST